jgi:mRNA interferase MazF
MEVIRGDLVIVVIPGEYGKPRPALIVQSDAFSGINSITVLPLTSDLHPAPLVRITVEPSPENGLERRSQIMIDKVVTLPRRKVGARIGHLEEDTIRSADIALAGFLSLP